MILKIKVKPNSKTQGIENLGNHDYKISLKSKPEDNKANLELLKLLKRHFKVELGDIKIIKGLKSKNKIIEIK
jgi:hypothetical protein